MEFEYIKNGKLLKTKFKSLIVKLDWKYCLQNNDKNLIYYLGILDTPTKNITIKIRPNKLMTVVESFKNITELGKQPPKGYTGRLVDYGTSVECRVSDNFLETLLKKVTVSKLDTSTETMEW